MAKRRKKKLNNKKSLSSSQKLKNSINAKKLTVQEGNVESVKKVLKEQQHKTLPLGNDTPSPKANAFFLLGVFPIVATGTLVYFNDEMREDFMNTLGIQSTD